MANSLKFLRKTALWLAGAGTALTGLYAAAGFYLAPYLLRAEALPRVAAKFGVQLAVGSVAFDPFALALRVRGVALKDRGGKPLLGLVELGLDLDGAETLRQRKAVFSARLAAPTLHVGRQAGGNKLNWLALAPPPGKPARSAAPIPPFLLTRLAVERGRVEFEDAAVRPPFATAWDAVGITLENLGPEPTRKASFAISAHSGNRESLSAAGTFSLAPFALDGKLEAAGLGLAAWAGYLAPDSPWRVSAGTAGFKAEYRLRAGDKPAFVLQGGTVGAENLALAAREPGGPGIKIAALSVGGLGYALAERRLRWDSFEARRVATPWLELASLALQGGAYAPSEQRVRLNSATLRDAVALGGTGPMDAPAPEAGDDAADPVPSAARHPSRAARIGLLRIVEIDASLKGHSVELGKVESERAEFALWRDGAGVARVRGLPEPPSAAAPARNASPVPAAPPWTLSVGEIQLADYALRFEDDGVEPPVRLDLAPLALRVTDFTTAAGRRFKFRLDSRLGDTGKLELDGQAQLTPLGAQVNFGVDKLWLRSVEPYWRDRVGFDLTRGRLNLWGDLNLSRDGPEAEPVLVYSGGADIVDLAAVDRREGKDLLRWNSLKFEELAVGTRPRRVSIRAITADHAYARVFIAADGGINLARDLAAPAPRAATVAAAKPAVPPQSPAAPSPDAEAWPVVVGAVRFADGRMDFTDQTLQPNFAADIQNLHGNIRGLSSQANAQADLFLEGRINQNSPVKIFGQTRPARFGEHTDITLEFRGVNLTTLSPYSGKFAGYRIEKGKLDMDLHYKLHDRALTADNRVVLDQLVLGERVDSPTATTLPVNLAIALLKDGDGLIHLDLPLSGHLDDPHFSLRGLYATAVTHFFTKLAGSPLSLLSHLVPDGSEDLGYVSFPPGEAALGGGEKDKLARIAGAIKTKPGLNLDIRGVADPRQDGAALAEAALRQRLEDERAAELRALGERVARTGGPYLSDEDYRRLFARYYRQRHPGAVLDGPVFERAKREVLEQLAVGELELRVLAQARGESIRDYLVREAGLPDGRVYLLDVSLVPPETGGIRARLSLSGS